jgi:hypothetical protein
MEMQIFKANAVNFDNVDVVSYHLEKKAYITEVYRAKWHEHSH